MERVEDLNKYIGCLKPQAFSASQSKGRQDELSETELPVIDPYRRDKGAIWNSKSTRSLNFKTQVFAGPENTYIRSRGDHTREVAACASRIAELTGLNSELAEAAAFGHDLGHVPYGHLGEKTISEIIGREFRHAVFSTVVAQEVERRGQGLNLAYETLLAIRWHSKLPQGKESLRLPLECKALMLADKISYTFHDVNDVIRLNFIDKQTILDRVNVFGKDQRARVRTCVTALVKESAKENTVSFSNSEVAQTFWDFQRWMFKEVYSQADVLRKTMSMALMEIHQSIERCAYFEGCDPTLVLALMTDRDVDRLLFTCRNKRRLDHEDINKLGIFELVPCLRGRQIDITKADLSWAE